MILKFSLVLVEFYILWIHAHFNVPLGKLLGINIVGDVVCLIRLKQAQSCTLFKFGGSRLTSLFNQFLWIYKKYFFRNSSTVIKTLTINRFRIYFILHKIFLIPLFVKSRADEVITFRTVESVSLILLWHDTPIDVSLTDVLPRNCFGSRLFHIRIQFIFLSWIHLLAFRFHAITRFAILVIVNVLSTVLPLAIKGENLLNLLCLRLLLLLNLLQVYLLQLVLHLLGLLLLIQRKFGRCELLLHLSLLVMLHLHQVVLLLL